MRTKYFYHNSDMRNTLRIKALRKKYGMAGYGVWICLLEIATEIGDSKIPFDNIYSDMVATDLNIREERLREVVAHCVDVGLITIDNNGYINIVEHFTTNKDIREKCSQAGRKGMESRWGKRAEYSPIAKEEVKTATIKAEKEEKKDTRFRKPTVEEVRAYCAERKNNIDANVFVNFYESKGWKVGKNSMKNWKAAVLTWENKNKASTSITNTALGVGEYIAEGRRTYGDGRAIIPADAPARPSAQHLWDAATEQWIIL